MITDQNELLELVEAAIQAKPKAYADVLAGKEKAANQLIGHIMQATKGLVDPARLFHVLGERCGFPPIAKPEKPAPSYTGPGYMIGVVWSTPPKDGSAPLNRGTRYWCRSPKGHAEFDLMDILEDKVDRDLVPEKLLKYVINNLY